MKISRLAAIENLPTEMQDNALLDWKTVEVLTGSCEKQARKVLADAGVPLVHVSERKKLPRWRDVREFLASRSVAA